MLTSGFSGQPQWNRNVTLGSGAGTVASIQRSLVVVISNNGDYAKINSAGIELFRRSVSTVVPLVKLDLNAYGSWTTASGGEGTTRMRHALGPIAGLVQITFDMYAIPDRLDCFYKGVLLASTGGSVSGPGTLQWAYAPSPGDPAWCLVVVSAPTEGTAWVYTMACPL